MSDYLKKRKRTENKKYKKGSKNGQSFSLKMNKQAPLEEEISFNPTSDNFNDGSLDFLKIGKFWEGSTLIEPKNTSGKLFHIETPTKEKNVILSQVEDSLYILNQNDLSIKSKLTCKEEAIVCFTYNNKGDIICAMANSLVRVFDINNLNVCKKVWKLNKEIAKIIKVDSTGKFLAIATSRNHVLVYDTDTYKLLNTFSEHSGFIYDLQFNPDKEKLMLYSASEDGTVKILDIILNKCVYTLEGHSNSVRHICLTNDGRTLISISSDNNIYIWKLGNKIQDITLLRTIAFTGDVASAMYFTRSRETSDAKELFPTLLLGCEDGSVCELDLKSGKYNDQQIFKYSNQPIIQVHYSSLNSKIFLLTADQTILELAINLINTHIKNAELLKVYPGYCQELLDIKFLKNVDKNSSNSNDYLFSSNDSSLKYYHKNSDSCIIKTYNGHSDFIMHIDVKNDFISTCSKDGTIRVWKYLYKSSEFEIQNLAIIKGHSEAVNSTGLLVKGQSKRLVSVSKDKSIKLWEFKDQAIDNTILNENDIQVINQSLKSEMAHSEEVNVVRVSPNEKLIASGSYDKTIKLFSNDLKLMGTITGHKRAITDLQFSQYAKILASSSTDKTIRIWNLNDYTCINTFEGHLASVLKVQWVYCGTHILSSGADGLVKIWNLKTSECLNTIDAHEGKIWALDVKENVEDKTCQFITGGTDSKVIQWNDITPLKETENLKNEEDKITKKEKLRFLNDNKSYYEGMKLSLELNHKNEFLNILKSYVDDVYRNNNGQSSYPDNISLIINNRKALDEVDENFNQNDMTNSLKKTISTILNDKELKNIITSNLGKILEITRDFTIKSNNFLYAQILLKFILVGTKHEIFNNNMLLGKKNKKLRKQKSDINSIENFTIIKSYSEKHLERINREVVRAYLIDFVVEKMKII